MARKLASVPDGAVAEVVPPPTKVKDAADHSERAFLVALRTTIANDIDNGVPPAYLAPLARQVKEIDREIRALDARLAEERNAEHDGPTEDEAFDASAI